MVTTSFSELFVVIAESAAALIGLLFVAVTVANARRPAGSQEIGEYRAAASLLAFMNALTVSLFGIVPGNNLGYASLIMGVIGVFFAGAGVRTILAQPRRLRRRSQLLLIIGLLVVFGFEIVYGILLIGHPHSSNDLSTIGNVLIASLLIGIGRAWEMVGSWDTGIVSSLRHLFGRAAPRVDE